MAVASSCIICLRSSLDRKHERKISKLYNFLTKLLINQSRVRVGCKETVIMLLAKLYNISLSDHWFAACHHVQIYAKLFTLCDNFIHVFKCKICLVSICARPATNTVHITSHCRVKKNKPRHVTAILFSILANLFCATEKCFVS